MTLTILVEGHQRKISVNFFSNQAIGQGGDITTGFSIFSSGHFVQWSGTILTTLVDGH